MCQNNPTLSLSHLRRKHSNSWNILSQRKRHDETGQKRAFGERREVLPGLTALQRKYSMMLQKVQNKMQQKSRITLALVGTTEKEKTYPGSATC